MSGQTDDYLSNPDGIPNDEQEIDRILAELEGEFDEQGDDAGQPAGTGAKGEGDAGEPAADQTGAVADSGQQSKQGEDDPKAQKQEGQGENTGADDEPERVVKTRDGRHEIPYSVLEGARKQATEYQREAERLRQELEQLRQGQAPSQGAQAAPQQDGGSPDSGEKGGTEELDLEAFRRDYGDELAKPLEVLYRQNQQLREEIERRHQQAEERVQQTEQQRIQAEVDQAKAAVTDANGKPVLIEWEQSGDPRYAAAVALDEQLRANPEYQDYSLEDRFREVVKMLGVSTASQPNTEDVTAAAARRLQEAERASDNTPNSLSDLPGGAAAGVSESEEVERMSATQLAEKLDRMTDAQREEFLSRL
ncbi:hypothetical protein [Halorhodospira sp. 9622]|uniref:hypothetical protein n=1 Tax=Halorhodospira sp. 9622 TaxID=2899136 RepID=UPI001EE90D0A|nr:hypothetical protein [Halorhodospira sp. 9622]MCG5537866.1 hypothetical protein [Halorhodospira sp. 9622]